MISNKKMTWSKVKIMCCGVELQKDEITPIAYKGGIVEIELVKIKQHGEKSNIKKN